MDWTIYSFGVLTGVAISAVALPFLIKKFINKKINELTGGIFQ